MPSDASLPELAVALELPPTLVALSNGSLDGEVSEMVASEVSALLERFGIPGRPTVSIRAAAGPGGPNLAFRPLLLTIGGRRCRLPAEDVQRIIGYVQGRPAVPRAELLGLFDLAGDPGQPPDAGQRERWHEFLRLACRQAISRQPAVLLPAAQSAAYAGMLSVGEADADQLHDVLRRVLAQRISLADRERVQTVLDASRGGDADLVAETLISELQSEAVELQAPRAFLAELSRAWDADPGGSGFERVREALRDESGITYPSIRLVADDSLRPRSLRIKLNDLEGAPWVGLATDHCMVSAEPAKLASASIAAEPVINPATGVGASLAPLDTRTELEAQGWTTWTTAEHALLCLTSAMRTYARCFIDVGWVEDAMRILEREHPELIATVRERIPPGRLTHEIRELVAAGTPIRDLAQVLYLLLEYTDEADCTDLVRRRVQRSLLRRWAFGFDRDLIVGLLASPAFERRLAQATSPERDETVLDSLLDVLQEEMDFLPGGSGVPLMLTSPDARAVVREELSREFPRLGVISAAELPATAHVVLLGELRPRSD